MAMLTLSEGAGSWAPRVSHIDINFIGALPPTVTAAVSRKLQGSTNFDLNLPLSGSPAIEPRLGGPTQIILTFGQNLATTAPLNVTLRSGTGSASYLGNTQISIGMSGATDGQVLTIMLTGPQVVGGAPGSYTFNIGVLLGDVDSSGAVNVADVSYIKLNSGVPVTSANFLDDIDCSGSINVADVSYAKLKSGYTLLEASGQLAFVANAQLANSGGSLVNQSMAPSVPTLSVGSSVVVETLSSGIQPRTTVITGDFMMDAQESNNLGPSMHAPQQTLIIGSLANGPTITPDEDIRDAIFDGSPSVWGAIKLASSDRKRTTDADPFDWQLSDSVSLSWY